MAASLSQCNQGDSKNERQFALHPLHTLLLIINVDLQLGRSRCVAIILQKKKNGTFSSSFTGMTAASLMMTLPAAEPRLRPFCGLSETLNNGSSVWMMHRTDVHVVLASPSKAKVQGNPHHHQNPIPGGSFQVRQC